MSWVQALNFADWIILADWVIRLVMLLVVLRRRFVPATALAWLSIIFFLPKLGTLLYLLFGGHRLGHRRVRRYRRVVLARRPDEPAQTWQAYVTRPVIEQAHLPVILQAERISGMPIMGGNHVELLGASSDMIDRMIADVDAAQYHVHMQFYIYRPDKAGRRVTDALVRAARRGVQCRLLADAAGSLTFFRNSAQFKDLVAAAVEVRDMLPVNPLRGRLARLDLRNHRKTVVIDGRVAYTGSHNVVDEDFGPARIGPWVDLSGRFTGPVVAQLQSVFLDDWFFETGDELDDPAIFPPLEPAGDMAAQAVPTGPSEDSQTLQRVLLAAINSARRRLIITTPYLVPDEPTSVALEMAAHRGVEVDLVIPRRSDHRLVAAAGRSYYEQLLEAGVRIFHYCGGLLHAKTMTVDDAFGLLGSSNLDIRSFYLNFELNVLLYGPQITHELRFAQTRYINECETVELDTWRKRPAIKRYAQSAAALFSPLL